MTFQEFQQQVMTIGFSADDTSFSDLSAPHVGTWYQAQNGFSGVTYNGKFQVLINGANSENDKLKHEDIKKAEILAERRAACWGFSNYQSTDYYDEFTFDFNVD
jgi:hypothetical protein